MSTQSERGEATQGSTAEEMTYRQAIRAALADELIVVLFCWGKISPQQEGHSRLPRVCSTSLDRNV